MKNFFVFSLLLCAGLLISCQQAESPGTGTGDSSTISRSQRNKTFYNQFQGHSYFYKYGEIEFSASSITWTSDSSLTKTYPLDYNTLFYSVAEFCQEHPDYVRTSDLSPETSFDKLCVLELKNDTDQKFYTFRSDGSDKIDLWPLYHNGTSQIGYTLYDKEVDWLKGTWTIDEWKTSPSVSEKPYSKISFNNGKWHMFQNDNTTPVLSGTYQYKSFSALTISYNNKTDTFNNQYYLDSSSLNFTITQPSSIFDNLTRITLYGKEAPYEGDPGTGSGGDETITLSGTYSFENDSTKELSFDNGNWKYYYNAAERQSGSYTISDTTLSMSQTGFEDYPSRFALESTQTSVTLISQDTISNILNGFGITENSLTLIKK